MNDVISIAAVTEQIKVFRQQAGVALIAAEEHDAQAAKDRARAATLEQCAGDLEAMLRRMGKTMTGNKESHTAAKLRYRESGLTTEMIGMICCQPGIDKYSVLAALREREDTRGTGGKMLRRAAKNGDVREDENGKLYLTEQGEAIWRQSPVFRP